MRQNSLRSGFALLVAVTTLTPVAAVDAQESSWARFRGPNGSGVSNASDLPAEFGPESGVVWSQSVPDSKSSPVVGDRHVFITAEDEGELVVLAFDRDTGELAWRTSYTPSFEVEMFPDNNAASTTPVTDGENVFVLFSTFGVIALDGEGEEMWRLPIEPIDNFYGQSASPLLAGDTLILLFDQRQGSYLVGLDRLTGAETWRRERVGRVESYTTPVLYPPGGDAEQVMVVGSTWLDSYSVETGEPFWAIDGFGYWPISSPAVADGYLLAAGPDQAGPEPETFEAILAQGDADGDGLMSRAEMIGLERYAGLEAHFSFGDVDGDDSWNADEYAEVFVASTTDQFGSIVVKLPGEGSDAEPEITWRDVRAAPYHATPLALDGHGYFIADNGIMTVVDLANGEMVRRDRVSRAGMNLSASPVVGDGKMYLATAGGELYVLSLGADWEVLATNDLGEPMFATPALVDGRIFVRTSGHLYAFGTGSN